jgi:hypothetical protein
METKYFKWKRKRKRGSGFRRKGKRQGNSEKKIWKLSGNISQLGPYKEATFTR